MAKHKEPKIDATANATDKGVEVAVTDETAVAAFMARKAALDAKKAEFRALIAAEEAEVTAKLAQYQEVIDAEYKKNLAIADSMREAEEVRSKEAWATISAFEASKGIKRRGRKLGFKLNTESEPETTATAETVTTE